MTKSAIFLSTALLALSPGHTPRNRSYYDEPCFFLDGMDVTVSFVSTPSAVLPIHLDDGTKATAQVESTVEGDGGYLLSDSFQLHVTYAGGEKQFKAEFLACYHAFQLAAVDLVGGPGDEILLVSQQERGWPAFSPLLQIYAIADSGLIDLGEVELGASITACGAQWEEHVHIQPGPKPLRLWLIRSINLLGCAEEPEVGYERAITKRELSFSEQGRRFTLSKVVHRSRNTDGGS